MAFLKHARKFFRTYLMGAGASLAETRASTWIGMISAIVGGVIGLQTYALDVSKKVDERVEKTFEMIALYNGDELRDPRARVLSYVNGRRECDFRYVSRDLVDDDFVRVIEFFDLVHVCVEADLCDKTTAKTFFSPHANYQWPVLTRTVDQMRESTLSVRSDPNFALGLKAFATTPLEAPPCDGNF